MNAAPETIEPRETPGEPPRYTPAPHDAPAAPRAAVVPPQSAFDPRSKSPVVASFLSVMPGLGQVYVGHYRLAFLHMLIVAGTITVAANDRTEMFVPLAPMFLVFYWLYNIIDAGRRAALYNYAMQGGADIDLPAGTIPTPGSGGTIAAGLVLLVGGTLLLLHTGFGYSLEWMRQWWPLAPMGFGAWLVVRGLQERGPRH